MKRLIEWFVMYKKIIIFVFFIFSTAIINAQPPLRVGDAEINGMYIGTYIRYLSEEKLFSIISGQWQADELFREKIKSGQLHSDRDITVKIENTDSGYRAFLESGGRAAVIEWGLKDILKPEVLAEFEQSGNETLKLNFMPHSYWLAFDVENEKSSPVYFYLQVDKHLFNMFHLFSLRNDEIIVKRADFLTPLADREVRDSKLTLKIEAGPGLNTYYLRVDNWLADVVPVRLWSEASYYRHLAGDNAILGILAGIFILVFIYNFFIFLFLKNKNHLYLAAMTICILVIMLVESGTGFQYIWPKHPYTGIVLFYSYFPLMMIFTLLFSRSFLEIYRFMPLMNRYVLVLVILLAVFLPVIFIVPFEVQKILFSIIFIFDYIYYLPLFVPAGIAVYKKNRYGLFLLAALSFYFLSQVEWILTNLNIIPIRFLNYLQIKGVSFVMIMILGLGYRFRNMKNLIADYKIKLQKAENKLKDKAITDAAKIKIENVKEFLKDNFRENISRESLAGAVEMSPDHLGRVFKKDTGIRISDYINTLRAEEAARLLENRDRKIIEIAYEVGFESLRTFNAVFLQMKGVTPSEYRKSRSAEPET